MIPVGYMSKKVALRPEWLRAEGVQDVCAVSGCISAPFADYIRYWKHNGYWLFNSARDIETLCAAEGIDASGTTLFYYAAYEKEYDEGLRAWRVFEPEASLPTRVEPPGKAELIGFDVVTFARGAGPECSPLSCNGLASEMAVNRHCLFDGFDEAVEALDGGRFDDCEPGPYRVFAVYRAG
jgi:hypothetical protein